MTVSNNPQCCGRTMSLVTGDNPYWDCPLCGTRLDREGTTITSGGNGYEHPNEPKPRGNGYEQPNEPDTSGNGYEQPDVPQSGGNRDEIPEDNPAVPAPVTDFKPKCWNCGRVLGKYFSRPWSLRCRRCKASNRATLKGA